MVNAKKQDKKGDKKVHKVPNKVGKKKKHKLPEQVKTAKQSKKQEVVKVIKQFDDTFPYFWRKEHKDKDKNGNQRITIEERKRPHWAKPIRIQYIQPMLSFMRSPYLQVSGTIIPMNLETNRPPTPDQTWDGSKHNIGGITGYERGHIIGLQLGGPNVPQNIAPQTAGWQGAGQWRDFEKDVMSTCQKCYGWDKKEDLQKYGGSFNRKPRNLCDINMYIYMWKENIPNEYYGSVTCGDEKIPFKIYQPKAPIQLPYKWGNQMKGRSLSEQTTVILDHYDYPLEEEQVLENVALGLTALIIMCCGLCICGICAGIQSVLRKEVEDIHTDFEHDNL